MSHPTLAHRATATFSRFASESECTSLIGRKVVISFDWNGTSSVMMAVDVYGELVSVEALTLLLRLDNAESARSPLKENLDTLVSRGFVVRDAADSSLIRIYRGRVFKMFPVFEKADR